MSDTLADPAIQPKWTPGPWRISECWRPRIGNFPDVPTNVHGEVFWGYTVTGSNGGGASILPTLAHVHNFPDAILANARLIAAAPDLYDALVAAEEELRLLRMKDTASVYNPALKTQISVALAKARGDV